MSSFINVGASDAHTGKRYQTKKALKEALKADPASVHFDRTSMFEGSGGITGDEIPEGVKLSVVGPDPYNRRNFYATVSRSNGTVKVQ